MTKTLSNALKIILSFSWLIVYIVNQYFIKISYGYLICLSLFSLMLGFKLILTFFTKNPTRKNRRHNAFRRQCLYGYALLPLFVNEFIFESVYLVFFAALIIIIPLISVASAYIVRYVAKIETSLESDDEIITKSSDTVFRVKIMLPKWYKFIPFNLGNSKIRISYGVNGEYVKDEFVSLTHDKTLDLSLDFKYKGVFKAGIAAVEITDVLLLISLKKEYNLAEIKIYPKVSKVSFAEFIARSGEVESMPQLVKEGDKFDTREYKQGDSMKRLSWKLLARNNELYVRDNEFSSYVGKRVIFYDNRIIFHDSRQRYVDEKITETLVSLVKVFLHNRDEHQIYYFNNEESLTKLQYKNEKFNTLLDEISFIPDVEDIVNKQVAEVKKIMRKEYLGCEFIFLTARFDERLTNMIRVFDKSVVKIRIINVATMEDYDSKGLSKKLGARFKEIPITSEVSEYEKELLK